VKSIDIDALSLERHYAKTGKVLQIDYVPISNNFDVASNLRLFLRAKGRDNKITKLHRDNGTIDFMRYVPELKGFTTNIDELGEFISNEELSSCRDKIDSYFESGTADKLARFAHIHNILPNYFWI